MFKTTNTPLVAVYIFARASELSNDDAKEWIAERGQFTGLSKYVSETLDYESQIATALRQKLGGRHKAMKTLMCWTVPARAQQKKAFWIRRS